MAKPRARIPFRRCTHIGNISRYQIREWFLARRAVIFELIAFICNGVCGSRGLIDAIIPGNFPKFAVAVVRLHQSRPRHRSPQAMAFGPCRSSPPPQSGDAEVGGSCDRVFVFDRNCDGALCRQVCDPLCKESFTGALGHHSSAGNSDFPARNLR